MILKKNKKYRIYNNTPKKPGKNYCSVKCTKHLILNRSYIFSHESRDY